MEGPTRHARRLTFTLAATTVAAALVMSVAPGAVARELPKLGPNAVSVLDDQAYLKAAPAPDFWAFSPFDKPQFTSSACSIASVTMVINGLRGLPPLAKQKVLTQERVLADVGSRRWAAQSAEGGDGVTFADLRSYTRRALDRYGLADATMEVFAPEAADAAAVARVRAMLTANEQTADDVILAYFNQGVLTGDWNGPHVSVIGAYDASTDRVLMLDVDQEWYVPYWSPVDALARALVKPAPKNQGVLAGQTGGLIRVSM